MFWFGRGDVVRSWDCSDLISVFPTQLAKDLLHPCPEEEKAKHKLKRLVQSPNSYFMDVKCPGKNKWSLCVRESQFGSRG